MTFALQKRCSTTELSRHITHRKHPHGQFQPIGASGFCHGPAEVTFNRAWTQHKPFCDGFVAHALEEQSTDSRLGFSESSTEPHN